MDHEQSITLLSDLLAGRVSGERATAAWAHVGSCPRCQEVASTINHVRAAVRPGEPSPGEHPQSEDLVAFALGDDDLALDVLARVRLHVEHCAMCREAASLTRGAEAATGRGPDWVAGWLDRSSILWRVPRLAPALAVLAVLLAYPAWVGLVRYPVATRDVERSRRELAALEAREPTVTPVAPASGEPSSGGVGLLYLRPASRGSETPPRVRLRTTLQPVALEFDLGALAARRPAPEVRIEIRDRSGGSRWRLVERADRLWDPVNHLIVFLVPAATLDSGEHRVELRLPDRPEPVFVSRFAVEPGPPAR